MKYDAVVVASGKGTRLNLGYNKVFYPMEDGRTILEHAMDVFLNDEDCKRVIVVTNRSDFDRVPSHEKRILVEGGAMRKDSVYEGLKKVESEYVLVHDGARPFLSKELVEALKDTLCRHDASILAVKAKDTIKLVKDGMIEKTIDRNTIYHAQTPQGFKTKLLKEVYEKAIASGIEFTDEASIMEYYDIPVAITESDFSNNKITFKEDLK